MPELSSQVVAEAITAYVVLLLSLSVHESAHAWMALRMGDHTAAQQGRITLNPLAHIDPVGTVLMPLAQVLFGGIPLLAWAKPTPVQASNFRPGMFRKGQVLVAGAGPVSNVLLALVFIVAFFLVMQLGRGGGAVSLAVVNLVWTGIALNVALAIFNLVPLPPLDGSWIASWGLPRDLGERYDRFVEPYGSMILLALVVTGALRWVMEPPLKFLQLALLRLAS